MINDYFKIAYKNLKSRRLRSFLTMLGIFIGIAAVVALISIGQGMQKSINDQFEALGVDKLLIQSKGEMGIPGSGGAVSLTKSDANIIKKVKGVDSVATMFYKSTRVEFDDKVKYTYLIGLPTDEEKKLINEVNNYKVDIGRELTNSDNNKAVLGINYRTKKIFSRELRLKDKILINY